MGYSAAYELLTTAHFWRLDWDTFDALDGDTQALLIAYHRTQSRFAAVDYWQNRATADGVRRGRRKAGRRGRG